MRQASNSVEIETPKMAKYGVLSPASTTIDLGEYPSDFVYRIADAGVKAVNEIIAGGTLPQEAVITVTANDQKRDLTYYPFNVKTTISASTMGANPEEIEKIVKDALEVVLQKSIERELWEGGIAKLLTDSSGNRAFANNDKAIDVTPTSGVGVKPRYAQAVLEGALGDSTIGYQGVIHAPRIVASSLKVKPVDDVLSTNLGTKVISGTGYSQMGPDGTLAPKGSAWMYATGPVTVLLGKTEIVPEKLNQAIDTRVNTISYHVDQPVGVVWATSDLFAVLVDLTADYA